jgi:predicted Zn-dependent protease
VSLGLPAAAQFPRLPRGAERAMKAAKDISEIQITTEQEITMGKEVAARMVQYMTVFDNETAAGYVRKVGAAVAAQAERKDVRYNFGILDTDDVNAFATPGGYIFVTRGLLENIKNESELAGVLGHEVGHVAGRHAISQIQTMKGIRIAGDTAKEFSTGSQFLADLTQRFLEQLLDRGLDHKYEYDADQRGMQYAYAAGYRPDGITSFLQILKPMVEQQEDRTAWLQRTHPKTQDRIDRLDKLQAEKGMTVEGRPDNFQRYQTTMKAAAAAMNAPPAPAGAAPVAAHSAAPATPIETGAALESLLVVKEKQKWLAFSAGQAAASKDMFTEGFTAVGFAPDGVAGMTGRTPAPFDLSDFKVTSVHPGTAVVTFRSKTPKLGASYIQGSSVWMRIGSEWKTVFYQGTKLP